MSKAPMIPDTKWVTLVKLSSPMLQEPSMTNTRSALAPLQTEERSEKPEEELKCFSGSEFETLCLCLWGRSPAQAGGMVGGGLGVGGSVGTGVGFTTKTKANM